MFTPTDTAVEPTIDDGRTFCAVHPTVETSLRCNKCGRYMCVRCAVRTPVGYRCKECVHQQQDAFFTASQADYLIAAAVAFGVGLPVAFILTRAIPFLLLVLILSFPAGSLIGDIAMRATGRRRGRNTWLVVAGAIVLSTIIVNFEILRAVLLVMGRPQVAGGFLLNLLTPVLYAALCAAGAVARLRYGK